MSKKLRKKIKIRELNNRNLTMAMLCAALLLIRPTSAWAATNAESITNGSVVINHDIDDVTSLYGLSVDNGASASMRNHFINSYSDGVHLYDNNTKVSLTNVAIRTSDTTGGSGIYGIGQAIATMSGGSIDAACYGVVANSSGCAFTLTDNVAVISRKDSLAAWGGGSINMAGGSLLSTGGGACVSLGTGSLITLTDVKAQAATNALESQGGGGVIATVHGQNIYGGNYLINIQYGNGTIAVYAYDGSVLTGATNADSGTATLSLATGATWVNTGTATLSSSLTNLYLCGGNIIFTAPAMLASASNYKTLTVNNALGGNGAFYLNSNLAASNGITSCSDRITGGAAVNGDLKFYVRNWGGVPSDLYQTVRLTNMTGVNTANVSGGSDVGAYRYSVAQGSALSGYNGVSSISDYYLYNSFKPSTPARVAGSDSVATTVMGYGEMNEIKKRMGELSMGVQSNDEVWARTYAEKFKVHPNNDESFESTINGVEIGNDTPRSFKGGKKYTGFLLGYGAASNDFSSGGSGHDYSTYLGSYASWLRDDGVYFDLVGKYNWFRHSFGTPLMGGGNDSGNYNNQGFSLSAEVGKRFQLDNGYFVEPAAELTGLWSTPVSYMTSNGLSVDMFIA